MKINSPVRVIPHDNGGRNKLLNRGPRHMYPFEVELEPVEQAVRYSLVIAQDDRKIDEIGSKHPVLSLEPVWDRLTPGFARFSAWAHFKDGRKIYTGETYSFYRAASFQYDTMLNPKVPLGKAIDMYFDFLTGIELSDNFDSTLPPMVWHCAYNARTRRLIPKAYPGLQYCNLIWAFLEYAKHKPEKKQKAFEYASTIVDKARSFITPNEFAWPGVPYSTISSGNMGGDMEKGHIIQPMKAAQFGSAFWDYGKTTGCAQSMGLAQNIGKVLAERQNVDGSLPVRVNAQTGEIVADKTTNLVWALNLWERLEVDSPGMYALPKLKALQWLLENPVANFKWISNFDDVSTEKMATDSTNYNNSDAAFTAEYLLKHRDSSPAFLDKAVEINRWIEEGFVFYNKEYPVESMQFPYPSVMEQASHYYPIDSHMARFALLQLALHEATGQQEYLQKAQMAAHSLTHYFNELGEPLTYPPDQALGEGIFDMIWDVVWFGCSAYSMIAVIKIQQALNN